MKSEDQQFKPFIHYGIDLEKAVIGICLLEKTALSRCYGLIEADCFYHSDHQLIFKTMAEMYGQSIPVDLLTVTHRIVENHGDQLLGGNAAYVLTACTNHVVSGAHMEYHCHLIREMWRRREVVKLQTSFPQDGGFDLTGNIRSINEQLHRIAGGKIKSEWQDMSELVYNLMIHQSEMAEGKKTFTTTGFKKIDEKNGGFYAGQMIVIGARPAVGKSALMGKMAISMAKQGRKVGIISLEMINNEIAARLCSLDTNIEFWKIYRTIAKDAELHKQFYDKVSRSLVQLPIYVSDKTRVNITDIKAKAMKLKASRGCDVIMVDYLQLIDSEQGNRQYNREQEVSKMSRGLKLLAMEMEIPVIVLCQLNRAITNRAYKDRFPKQSDLRESGAIEQDADVLMFIHRDYMSGYEVDEQGNSTEFNADLIAPKWRNGAPCHLPLGFDPEKMNFYERTGAPTGFIPINYSEPISKDEEDPF
jgi:replicative DNA helicase